MFQRIKAFKTLSANALLFYIPDNRFHSGVPLSPSFVDLGLLANAFLARPTDPPRIPSATSRDPLFQSNKRPKSHHHIASNASNALYSLSFSFGVEDLIPNTTEILKHHLPEQHSYRRYGSDGGAETAFVKGGLIVGWWVIGMR